MEIEEEAIRRVRELERDEPLLRENPRRFVMFPIEHPDIWQFYKKAEGEYSRLRYVHINRLILAPSVY